MSRTPASERPARMSSSPVKAVDPSDPIPLYAQIERALRRMIMLPEFLSGVLLPDELTLANQFGVSRGTVRVALTRMVDQRLVERKPGVGTRVLTPAESSLSEWRSFSKEMARRGIAVECFHLSTRSLAAPERVASALQIGEGSEVLRLDRIRGWGGLPVLHSRSWLHPRLGVTRDADFSRPLYEIIQEASGASVESAREELSAVEATAALAKGLRVKAGTPLLLRRHTVFDRKRRPMEFAEIHYVSKRFALTLNLKKEQP